MDTPFTKLLACYHCCSLFCIFYFNGIAAAVDFVCTQIYSSSVLFSMSYALVLNDDDKWFVDREGVSSLKTKNNNTAQLRYKWSGVVDVCCLSCFLLSTEKDDENGSWGVTEKAVASTTKKKLFGLGLFLACVRFVTLNL